MEILEIFESINTKDLERLEQKYIFASEIISIIKNEVYTLTCYNNNIALLVMDAEAETFNVVVKKWG